MVFVLDIFFRKCDGSYCEAVIVNMAKNWWRNWQRTGDEYGKQQKVTEYSISFRFYKNW